MRQRLSKQQREERNKAICAAYLAGGTLATVGKQFKRIKC